MCIYTYQNKQYPGKYVLRPECEGSGTELYGSMKGAAYSAEDFYQDPDFARDYCNGSYDVPCSACKGRTTVTVPDVSRCTFAQKRTLVEDRQHRRYTREREAARERWLNNGCWGDY